MSTTAMTPGNTEADSSHLRAESWNLSAPVVLTGRGGSGTRLFSTVLQELGVFMGNRLNKSDDSAEWVDLLYEVGIAASKPLGTSTESWVKPLQDKALEILTIAADRPTGRWGWKLPETMLALDAVTAAFANCRIIHVVRHPVDTCLRRTHMTSRMGSPIGHAVLTAAYRHLGWERDPRKDPDHIRNAASWVYQLQKARDTLTALESTRSITVQYESLCDSPEQTIKQIADFIDAESITVELGIDKARRRLWAEDDPRVDDVWNICGGVARDYGYGKYPMPPPP